MGRALPELIRRRLCVRTSAVSADQGLIRASVLVPIFEAPGERGPRVWLLRRPDTMRTHQGQVALPGGKWDRSDENLLATALREAREEIGLEPQRVEFLGGLDELPTRTGFVVSPFVGWVEGPFEPVPRPEEVAHTFSAPLSLFEAPPERVTLSGACAGMVVPAYRHEGETIWGATAAILRGLVERIGSELHLTCAPRSRS